MKTVGVLVAGIHDLIVAANGSNKATVEAYKSFVDTAFPFAAKSRVDTDKQIVEAMRKEANRGPITFTTVETPNPLQKMAARMRLPEDFKEKFQKARRRE